MPKPSRQLVEPAAQLSGRRGALSAGVLVCAVLLVVGYGSGIGVVLSDAGVGADEQAGAADGGDADDAAPDAAEVPVAPAAVTGPTTTVGTTRRVVDGGPDGSTSTTTWPTASVSPPTTPATRPPATGAPPGSTSPPPTSPPASCVALTDALLQGLIGYLGGSNPDVALVQQVGDVLGLGQLLVQDDGLLGAVVAPVTGATAALVPDASLIPALRTLLGVEAVGAETVTGGELTALLDGVLRGC